MKSFPGRAGSLSLLGIVEISCSHGGASIEAGMGGGNGGAGGAAQGGTATVTNSATAAVSGMASGGGKTGLGGSSAIGGSSAVGGITGTTGTSSATATAVSGGSQSIGGSKSTGNPVAGGGTHNVTGGAPASGGTQATASEGTRIATGGTLAGGGTQAASGGASGGTKAATGGAPSTTPRTCTFPADWAPSNPTYTYYDLPNASTACGYNGSNNNISNISNGQYFAAIPGQSSSNFDTSSRCGACVKINNTIITIVDECPYDGGQNKPCANNPKGHLDLSRASTSAAGVQGDPNVSGQAKWSFVPCPVTGNVKVRLKPGNNNEFFIENEILPIQSVTCSGQTGSRTSYGAWHFGANVNGTSCSATDIGNASITFAVGSTQGQDVDTGIQFQKCS